MRLWVISCSPLQFFIWNCVLLRGCWGKVNRGIMRLQWLLRTRVSSISKQEAAASVLVHNGETFFVFSLDNRKELKHIWSYPHVFDPDSGTHWNTSEITASGSVCHFSLVSVFTIDYYLLCYPHLSNSPVLCLCVCERSSESDLVTSATPWNQFQTETAANAQPPLCRRTQACSADLLT